MFKYAYPHSTGRSFRRTLGSKTPATDSLERDSSRIPRLAVRSSCDRRPSSLIFYSASVP